jgi:rhodanese-related sulfurtransferase
MPTITKGFRQLVDEANAQIKTYPTPEAINLHGSDRVLFVDLRDVRELEREGVIPGAFHAPRGMLEFWVDPESPYHKPFFTQDDKEYVLFCGGGWRSALATKALKDMGMTNVAHFDGGFAAWKKAGGPVGDKDQKA